jgi:hypothetical protein
MLAMFCCLAGLLNGCATKLPTYGDVANRISPIQPGYARVYFYTMVSIDPGGGLAYKFTVDGVTVGKICGFQFLFVDHPAGSIKVTLNSAGVWPAWLPNDLALNLVSGETRYIKGGIDPGYHLLHGHLKLILVDPDQGAQDIKNCHYMGPSLP